MPKPGLYKGGLLKSLMTWAIPLSLLEDQPLGHPVHFVSIPLVSPHFVALLNTVITPVTPHPRWALPPPGLGNGRVPTFVREPSRGPPVRHRASPGVQRTGAGNAHDDLLATFSTVRHNDYATVDRT